MVEPTGVESSIEINIPDTAHTTEIIAELTITTLNPLNTLIEDRAGKIIKADINREPTKFIANTSIIAGIMDIIVL